MKLTFEQKTDIGFQYVVDMIETSSPFGQELLRKIDAFSDKEALETELYNLERLIPAIEEQKSVFDKTDVCLMQLKDITPTIGKCRETALSDVELFEMKRFLLICRELCPKINELAEKACLCGIKCTDLSDALSIVDPDNTGVVSFYISDRTSEKLAQIRKEKKEIETKIRLCEDKSEKELLLAERTVITAREEEEERNIRRGMTEKLAPYLDSMLENCVTFGRVDILFGKAKLAAKRECRRPEISSGVIAFSEMVNPKMQDRMTENGKSFTPVSIEIGRGATVITGANMGGKSVALKTAALNTYLTLCGIFPFAKSAKVPFLTDIFMISEDLESADRGLSSFGGEIIRFNEIAEKLDENSLLLLDEFARGTNPDEGAAIVKAVTSWLDKKQSFSVLTTHFDGVAPLASAHYQVIGLKNLDFDDVKREIASFSKEKGADRIAKRMNYGLFKVTDKQDCPKDALNICRLLGLNDEIVKNAEKMY